MSSQQRRQRRSAGQLLLELRAKVTEETLEASATAVWSC